MEAERNDSHCRHAKLHWNCGSIWVFMNFEKGTVGTKPLLSVLTNCPFWWIKCHECSPRMPSGAGAESPPDSLRTAFLRVPVMYEEHRVTRRWVPYLRGAGAVGVAVLQIRSHHRHVFRADTHYRFHIFLASSSTFSLQIAPSQKGSVWIKWLSKAHFFLPISISCPLTLKKQRWELFNRKQPCAAWVVSDLHGPSANILSGAKIPQLFC